METQVGQIENLKSLWFVAAAVVATLIALRVHRSAQKRFATANLIDGIVGTSSLGKKLTSIALTSLAMILLAVASTDIRWGKAWREVPQKGIEIVFVLDVSRSMLATDVVPNRLSKAKQNIEDIVNEMSGDRVGLVLFAGDVRRHIPLTSHYEDFKQNLAEVGPHHINRGGTNLGDAIRIASDSFLQKTADQKAIVIITDGEDHQSDPDCRREGSPRTKRRSDLYRGIGRHQRRSSHSARIRQPPTRVHATRWQTSLVEVGRRNTQGDRHYDRWSLRSGGHKAGGHGRSLSPLHRRHSRTAIRYRKNQRLHSSLSMVHWIRALRGAVRRVSEFETQEAGNRNSREQTISCRRVGGSSMNAIRVLLLIALFTGIACAKENAARLAQKASESLEQGDFESAIQQYEQAQALSVDPRITYNKAIAHYRRGEIDTARGLFESIVGKSDQQLAAKARYNIGNAYYSEAVKFLEDKNPTVAISKLSSAIEEYRRALTLNRKDRDARTNIELAYRLRKQLEQEQQQQQDDQQQQQDEDQAGSRSKQPGQQL